MRLSSLNLPNQYISSSQNTRNRCLELSLVIPTYNERANIEELIVEICRVLDNFLETRYEIIVVDDNSPDHTGEVVRHLSTQYPQVRLISRDRKKGLATAVVAGWKTAKGRILGVIDGDFQHPPLTLKKLLNAIYDGADLAIASRYLKRSKISYRNYLRNFMSCAAIFIARTIFPQKIGCLSDPISGYFLVRRNTISKTKINPLGYKVLIELIVKCNINRITEVEFVFGKRAKGKAKLRIKQCMEYLIHIVILRCIVSL